MSGLKNLCECKQEITSTRLVNPIIVEHSLRSMIAKKHQANSCAYLQKYRYELTSTALPYWTLLIRKFGSHLNVRIFGHSINWTNFNFWTLDDGIYSDSIEINEIIQRNFLSWNNWVRSRIFVSNEYNDEFVLNEWIILRKCWNYSNMSYRTHKKP